jgi:hypothetical protein
MLILFQNNFAQRKHAAFARLTLVSIKIIKAFEYHAVKAIKISTIALLGSADFSSYISKSVV